MGAGRGWGGEPLGGARGWAPLLDKAAAEAYILGMRLAWAWVGAIALGWAGPDLSVAVAASSGQAPGAAAAAPQVAVVPLDHKPTAAEQRRLAASPPAAKPLPASCDPAAAEALLRSGVTLIDVRSPEEFAEGHVAGARLLPLPELERWAAGLDPKKPYLVMCRSGARSARAIAALKAKGFTQLINLEGGMLRWQGEAKPVARP